ncbi:Taxane 13-alpha-hydroxylase [Citrus sinensis]|nr:Taxane 13-alpha-hydroxylase [Citrus sinensis]
MIALLIIFLLVFPIFLLLTRRRSSAKGLPPGSLGIPIIGQSLAFLHAIRSNTAEQWLELRARKYDPISKLNLFGKPTIFIHGQAANKLVFSSDSNSISNQQTQAITLILGDRSLLNLTGQDHRRVRDALLSFLKPESLKKYVGKIDGEIRQHIEFHRQGKEQVTVLPLMKTLTFNIICSFLFGLERGKQRDQFLGGLQDMIKGAWAENEVLISDDEIVHNVMLVMVAGHDTSAILITFLMRLFANDPAVYAAVLQEQEEIAKGKQRGEFLTWEDLAKMFPPIFGGFRKALKDIEYGRYVIPEGWQIFWVASVTHMDDTIFPEPSKFDPSIFENQASIPPYCYVPFGAGPRICPGYEFARIETLVAIHYLITHFKWKLLCSDNFFSRNPTSFPSKGLPVQITPKKIL